MNCSCSIDVDFDDCDDVVIKKFRKARKSHICGECKREIKKGESYEVYKALYDGSWSTYKTCADCASVRSALFCNWYFGEIWNLVHENFGDSYSKLPSSEYMMQMTKPGRDKVCDIIENSWSNK